MNEDKYQKIVSTKIMDYIDNKKCPGLIFAVPIEFLKNTKFEILNKITKTQKTSRSWLVNETQTTVGSVSDNNQIVIGNPEDIQRSSVDKIDYAIINTKSFFPNKAFLKILFRFKPRLILLSGNECPTLIQLEFLKFILLPRSMNRKSSQWMSLVML